MNLLSRLDLRNSKIKHVIWSLLRKQITDFEKVVNGWSASETSKLEPFGEIINKLNSCQTSMMEHFTNTVIGWNPCWTSRMKLFVKVVNGWSLRQISRLELFGKIFNQSNPCQTSKMDLLQKQLSDEVRVKYLRCNQIQNIWNKAYFYQLNQPKALHPADDQCWLVNLG